MNRLIIFRGLESLNIICKKDFPPLKQPFNGKNDKHHNVIYAKKREFSL